MKEPPYRLMSDIEPQATEWLWKPRIALGEITILDGDPGANKSCLLVDLTARVSKGTPMPDTQDAIHGGVVLLVAEGSIRKTVHARLTAAGADMTKVAVPDWFVTIPDSLPALEQMIVKLGAKLLVIDPLMTFLVRYAGMEQAVRDALNKLRAMAERTNAAVVAVRHLSKSGGRNSLYRGLGSIGIIAVCRSGLLLAKDPEDPNLRVLCQLKNNLGPLAPTLLFEPMPSENGSVCIEWRGPCDYEAADLMKDNKHGEKKLNEAMEFLSELLAKGPIAVNDIKAKAVAQGLAWRTVERAKEILGLRSEREGWGPGSRCFWSLPSHNDGEDQTPPAEANRQEPERLDDNDEYF